MTKQLFGTDGIRGLSGQDPITVEMGFRLGRAVVLFCQERGLRPRIIIGRDTRLSGAQLEQAIVSGVQSAGGGAYLAGVIPTPAVALLTRELDGGAGIVISASHNPSEYNGFKVFSKDGYKFSEAEEAEIERSLQSGPDGNDAINANGGIRIEDADDRYLAFVEKIMPKEFVPLDMSLILDCANGATHRVAPALFERLGARVEAMFVDPDGENINRGCGSQHTEALRAKVMEKKANAGLAFDGDGDRFIAVDERGHVLSGDQLLMIYAKTLKNRGKLRNDIVVSTVMSNMGFRLALEGEGLTQVASKVGDRHVMEEMRSRGANLGGEDSGHIIFLDHHTTGDGLLSALQLVIALKRFEQPLSRLSSWMTVFPQILVNVKVREKLELTRVGAVASEIERAEKALENRGRVLVRYSGTEPVCRVMVEGESEREIEDHARKIADAIETHLG